MKNDWMFFFFSHEKCLENSEFRCQNTGIFSNELKLGRKNAHFSLTTYIPNNKQLTKTKNRKSSQKLHFFIKKDTFQTFITYIISTRNIYSYARNIYSYSHNIHNYAHNHKFYMEKHIFLTITTQFSTLPFLDCKKIQTSFCHENG